MTALAVAMTSALCVTAHAATAEWPSYNRTLTSERFAPLGEIDTRSVARLKPLCEFDTGETVSFQTGLVQTAGAIFFSTEHDTFSIDPESCRLNWRAHEDFTGGSLKVNRGVAYLDGRVFRGTFDGRVIAYDARSGAKVWETRILDNSGGENITAAPVAWRGLVFIGNGGGNSKGVKGRTYALDAATGKVAWEFYNVPPGKDPHPGARYNPAADATWGNVEDAPVSGGATWTSYSLDPASGWLYVPTGAPTPVFAPSVRPGDNLYSDSVLILDARRGDYRRHFQTIPADFHDFDVSTPPAILTTRTGRKIVAEAPKDGHLYAWDLKTGERLYKTPATHVENQDEAIVADRPVRACPGHHGGAEWNGAAFNPQTNLISVPEVDWCAAVMTASAEAIRATPAGKQWTASGFSDPLDNFGHDDPPSSASGHVTSIDADTGKVVWRYDSKKPVVGAVTPTAGGLVFFGDLDGSLWALDARTGAPVWSQGLGGAIGGGLISYDTGKGQRIAVAVGMTSRMWPGVGGKAKVVVLGLEPAR